MNILFESYNSLYPSALILLVWSCISFVLYYLIDWIFRVTGIEKLIHRFLWHSTRIGSEPISKAIGKYLAVFVFLLFLRKSVEEAGYSELENFLKSVLEYLPHLLLSLIIIFFGIQTSRSSYSVIFSAVNFENPRTALVLAQISRIVILFFTFTIAINQVNTGPLEIIPEYLIRSILIGFVAAMSLAFWLAFGLWWKTASEELIREYLNNKSEETDSHEKENKYLKSKK